MSEYEVFFDDNPWENVVAPCYPEGHRLFLNNDRFWVSMDKDGRILFFVHDNYNDKLSPPESLAGVKIEFVKYANNSRRLICTLTSNDSELRSKFSIVTKDIAYKCANLKGRTLFEKVIEIIRSWASFLKPQRAGLSNAEYVGLWGELFVLVNVILKDHSPLDSMRFWVGPDGKKQDFTLNQIAIEVKTSLSSDARRITISSLEQLEKITERLYIYHVIANPSAPQLGISLRDLYEKCLLKIGQDLETKLIFLQKVTELYSKASDKQLNSKNELISQLLYEVTDGFPCLRKEDVPSSVVELRYDLLVSAIREYECVKSVEEIIKNG